MHVNENLIAMVRMKKETWPVAS